MQQPDRPLVSRRVELNRWRYFIKSRWRTFAIAAVVLTVIAGVLFWTTLPDVTQANKFAPGTAIQIFDNRNQLVSTIEGDQEREFVPLSKVPSIMQSAMLAAEDHEFYKHEAIDLKGIARAVLANLQAGRVVEGGSTITQQLAKILFFDPQDRSIIRKLREAVVAVRMEKHYTKKQILEMYLNNVYFGRTAYGIESASIRYFARGCRYLTLPQAAFLAGIVRQPSFLSDPAHLRDALARQHEVLDAMVQMHAITPVRAEEAKAARLVFNPSQTAYRRYPYYTGAVMDFLRTQFDKSVLDNGGLRVYTNLDPAAQSAAENALAHSVSGAPAAMNQAGLASVSVKDGAVVALVGGIGSYWSHQWNAATHAHTMGSSFKPFVYLTGFERGTFTPDSIIADSPISFQFKGAPDYVPKDFDNSPMGPMTVETAVALSRNLCAVRAAVAVGISNVIQTAQRAGLTARLDPTISLALGASAASPLDMAGAYATFARGGIVVPPQLVRRVDGRNGLLRDFSVNSSRNFAPGPIRMLMRCLTAVVTDGTGVEAQLPGRPVAGKTGTSDGGKDLWFVGFTPNLVTAVWGGNDKHQPLAGNVTGGAIMTRVWKRYNEAYYAAHPEIPAGSFESTASGSRTIWDALLKPESIPNQAQALERGFTPHGGSTPLIPESVHDDITRLLRRK